MAEIQQGNYRIGCKLVSGFEPGRYVFAEAETRLLYAITNSSRRGEQTRRFHSSRSNFQLENFIVTKKSYSVRIYYNVIM